MQHTAYVDGIAYVMITYIVSTSTYRIMYVIIT